MSQIRIKLFFRVKGELNDLSLFVYIAFLCTEINLTLL